MKIHNKQHEPNIIELLSNAVHEQNPDLVLIETIVKKGVNIYLPPYPITLAIHTSSAIDILKIFIKHGADVNFVAEGKSLLSHATWCSNLQLIHFLVQQGAQVNLPGNNLLSLIASQDDKKGNNGEIINFLIQQGANKDAINKDGLTPLYQAARCGEMNNMQSLLKYENNTYIKQHGLKLLHMFIEQSDSPAKIEVIKLFIDMGVDINACFLEPLTFFETEIDKSYSDPLLKIAAHNGCIETVKLLLKNGAKYDREWKVEEEGYWINEGYEAEIQESKDKDSALTKIYYAAKVADNISKGKEPLPYLFKKIIPYYQTEDKDLKQIDQNFFDVIVSRLSHNLTKFGIPYKFNNFFAYKKYLIEECTWKLPKELSKLIVNSEGTGTIDKLAQVITQITDVNRQLPSYTSHPELTKDIANRMVSKLDDVLKNILKTGVNNEEVENFLGILDKLSIDDNQNHINQSLSTMSFSNYDDSSSLDIMWNPYLETYTLGGL